MREAILVLAVLAVLVDVAISKSEHINRGEEAMAGDTSNEGMNAVCTNMGVQASSKVPRYVPSPPNKGDKTATALTKGPRNENISFGDAADEILEFGDCSFVRLCI